MSFVGRRLAPVRWTREHAIGVCLHEFISEYPYIPSTVERDVWHLPLLCPILFSLFSMQAAGLWFTSWAPDPSGFWLGSLTHVRRRQKRRVWACAPPLSLCGKMSAYSALITELLHMAP
jgi:hypothetical protein